MIAIILAGGQSECLRRGDEYVPKLLLTVGGKPLLEHHLDWLSRAGVDSVTLCLGMKADLVRSHFSDGERWGMPLRYNVEQGCLGTAGSVKALGAASLPDDTLVLRGDVWVDFDFDKMLEFHRSHEGLATIALRKPDEAGEAKLALMGPNRRIAGFPQYASDDPKAMGAAAVWLIRRGIMRFVSDEGPSNFLNDVFPAAVRAGEDLYGYPVSGHAVDLGTPELFERFRKRFAKSLTR